MTSPDMQKAQNELREALAENQGGLKMGFIQLNNGPQTVAIPEQRSLVSAIGGIKQQMMEMHQELVVMGKVLQIMTYGLSEDQQETVAEASADAITKYAADVRVATVRQRKEDAKPKIIQPGR